jgi:hypothetical protein
MKTYQDFAAHDSHLKELEHLCHLIQKHIPRSDRSIFWRLIYDDIDRTVGWHREDSICDLSTNDPCLKTSNAWDCCYTHLWDIVLD